MTDERKAEEKIEVIEVQFENGARFFAELERSQANPLADAGACARRYLEAHPGQLKRGWPNLVLREMTREEYMAIPATQDSAFFWKGGGQ